jgi:hypothetical protein
VAVRDLAIHPRDNALAIATHGRGIWIVDDLTPLRSLTEETLAKPVAVMPSQPTVLRIPAFGGWANGDAVFVGPNPSDDAIITYFLQKRHVFGDMTLEVRDSSGAVLASLPATNRRGLNQVTWSMRKPPARIPPAAQAGFGPGPRYLPGTYTVRLVDGANVATAPLKLVPDPRATYTMADRHAQNVLANRLYALLDTMTTVVDKMNALRNQLDMSAAGLKDDPLAARLRAASAQVDSLRKKIVATKEGGAITGEERLREYLLGLYGGVTNYDGKPTDAQVQRASSISKELADVSGAFNAWAAKELPALNKALTGKGMREIVEPK